MSDEKPNDEDATVAKATEQHEAAQHVPRGNVHSEADEDAPEMETPPPLTA